MKVWILVVTLNIGGSPSFIVDNITTQAECIALGKKMSEAPHVHYMRYSCFEVAKVKS